MNTSITITDQANNTITFPQPCKRIITTSTYATEYLIILGAEDRIIGVSSYIRDNEILTEYLKNAQIIGVPGSEDIEKIVALHPDVLLLPISTSENAKKKYRDANIQTIYLDFLSLETIPDIVRSLSKITGNVDRGEEFLTFFDKYNNIISDRLQDIDGDNSGPSVFYESGEYSTGTANFNYLSKLKANNIVKSFHGNNVKVSPEWIIANNPSIIIKTTQQAYGDIKTLKDVYYSKMNKSEMKIISAGKNNRTYVMSTNVLYGPRVIIGMLTLGKIIYPERFEDIDPYMVLDEYSANFFPNANKTELIYPKINNSKNYYTHVSQF